MKKYILFGLLSALFYALSIPLSKLLLEQFSSVQLSGLLYFGAGIGMGIILLFKPKIVQNEENITKSDLPYTILMILLDIIAPILLMTGLTVSNSETVALLGNFEIVATSLIALIIFKEKIHIKLWIGILLITMSCILLSIGSFENVKFSFGSLFVLGACLCWGLENNCTKKLSSKNPLQIVFLKGIFSGFGALIVSIAFSLWHNSGVYFIFALLLGFFSYGLSVLFYILCQRGLGAAKTSAIYALNSFFSVLLSFLIFGTSLNLSFLIAFVVMSMGMLFVVKDTLNKC